MSGKKLWVANDVFIHHYGSSSFKQHPSLHRMDVQESEKKFMNKWEITDLTKINKLVEREKPFNRERHYIPY